MYKKAQFFHYSKQKIFHVKKNNSSQRTLQNSKSITCQSQNIINTDIKLKRKKNLCFCPRRQTDITMQNFVRKCTYLEKIKKKIVNKWSLGVSKLLEKKDIHQRETSFAESKEMYIKEFMIDTVFGYNS